MSFFRTFGLFLSGFIVMCISFDRYFAVLRPLALPEANKRGRLMLYLAWGGSFVCSLPQVSLAHYSDVVRPKICPRTITLMRHGYDILGIICSLTCFTSSTIPNLHGILSVSPSEPFPLQERS